MFKYFYLLNITLIIIIIIIEHKFLFVYFTKIIQSSKNTAQ